MLNGPSANRDEMQGDGYGHANRLMQFAILGTPAHLWRVVVAISS